MENKCQCRGWLPELIFFLLVSILLPSPAWAFIPHWDPLESFFIRQFSYLFWAVGMIFFIIALRQENLARQRGFRWLVWSGIFFALWNVNCFIGQFLALAIFPKGEAVVTTGNAGYNLVAGRWLWLFYLSKLDHLLLVPAIVCFYLGIRSFHKDSEVES